MALCFSHSMKRFVITGDTGLPMSMPDVCLLLKTVNLKYVVVTINFNSSIMSCTVRFVRNFSVVSSSSLFLITMSRRGFIV